MRTRTVRKALSAFWLWVLVRPVVLNDKPPKGRVEALTDLSHVHGGTIARGDVATFVVDRLTDDRWLHQTPLIRW